MKSDRNQFVVPKGLRLKQQQIVWLKRFSANLENLHAKKHVYMATDAYGCRRYP